MSTLLMVNLILQLSGYPIVINSFRWLSKIHLSGTELELAPCMAPRSRIQYLLVRHFLFSWPSLTLHSTGKLFNAHTVENYDKPHVTGFTGSDFLLDPYTYQYLNSSFQKNHDPPVYYPGEYSTDILASKAYGLLDDAAKDGKPFFLAIAPNAPHSNVAPNSDGFNLSDITLSAPVSAERHKHLFKNVKIPRTANFNPKKVRSYSYHLCLAVSHIP